MLQHYRISIFCVVNIGYLSTFFVRTLTVFEMCFCVSVVAFSCTLAHSLACTRSFIWVETKHNSRMGGTKSTGSNEIFEMDFIKDPSIRKAIMIIYYFAFHYMDKKRKRKAQAHSSTEPSGRGRGRSRSRRAVLLTE